MIRIAHSVDELAPAGGTGVTIGNFDGVHLGHQALIRRMLAVCGREGLEPVVMTFWPHPRQVLHPDRGHQPLASRQDRFALLEALGVRRVLELPFTRALAALQAGDFVRRVLLPMRLRRLVVGHDFTLGRDRGGSVSVLRELGALTGFAVERLDPVMAQGMVVSSTALRRLIAGGDVRRAAALLGHWHGFSGNVVRGEGRGTGLGFPTANQERPDVILPAAGVYATLARLGGRVCPAVTNVGCKPTFGDRVLGVETFLLEGGGDLYGQAMRLEFVERLRGERRFDSVAALTRQIAADAEGARHLLSGLSGLPGQGT